MAVLFYDMYMIQLTDYLYNGDTLIRILHKYSAALEMEAKKTNNKVVILKKILYTVFVMLKI